MYFPKINLAIEYDRYVRNNYVLELNIEQERYLTQYVNLIKIRELPDDFRIEDYEGMLPT